MSAGAFATQAAPRSQCFDALSRPPPSPVKRTAHDVSAEVAVPVLRIASVIAERARSTAGVETRSAAKVVDEHGDWAVGPTLDQQMASATLRQAVGWTPQFNSLEDVELLREYRQLKSRILISSKE